MKIYCMSDIHGCIDAFNEALLLVLDHLDEADTKLVLLGDYIHGSNDNYGVLDKIINLQNEYGQHKVIALLEIPGMTLMTMTGMVSRMIIEY